MSQFSLPAASTTRVSKGPRSHPPAVGAVNGRRAELQTASLSAPTMAATVECRMLKQQCRAWEQTCAWRWHGHRWPAALVNQHSLLVVHAGAVTTQVTQQSLTVQRKGKVICSAKVK